MWFSDRINDVFSYLRRKKTYLEAFSVLFPPRTDTKSYTHSVTDRHTNPRRHTHGRTHIVSHPAEMMEVTDVYNDLNRSLRATTTVAWVVTWGVTPVRFPPKRWCEKSPDCCWKLHGVHRVILFLQIQKLAATNCVIWLVTYLDLLSTTAECSFNHI